MNEMIVFVDLDGVLVDFVGGINRVFSLPTEFPPPKNGVPQWDWFKHHGITDEQVNDICTSDFWANLKWTLDGHEIFRIITKYIKPENIYLLTCPMPNLESASGKAQWVNKHLPFYNDRLIITRAPKQLLAGSNRILIDDKTENIDEFRKAGGQGILVPRIWNRLAHLDNVLLFIEAEFDSIMSGSGHEQSVSDS